MLEKEKLIKEQRLTDAVQKNYMGLDGKFGIILKTLGSPIVFQNAEPTEWQDVYEMVEDDDDLPTQSLEVGISEIGRMFSGLKFGQHIEIIYTQEAKIPVDVDEYHTEYELASQVIKVEYKGYTVYLEAESSLIIYLPSDSWEDIINKIYETAEKIYKQKGMEHKELKHMETKMKKLSLLQRMRDRWGI